MSVDLSITTDHLGNQARQEVEGLVKKKHGGDYLNGRQAKTELARINREIKKLNKQIATLEERKSKLLADPGEVTASPLSNKEP